jgi:cytochrome c biogenesis protein CcdA
VLLAGLVDGINPCAFTVLLCSSPPLASLPAGPQDTGAVRLRLLGMGSIYIGAIFVTYLALGVAVGSLDALTGSTFRRAFALAAVLVAVDDQISSGHRLAAAGARARERRGSPLGSARHRAGPGGRWFSDRVVYRAMQRRGLSGRAESPGAATDCDLGYSYLVLYNLVFFAPLLAVGSLGGPALNRLALEPPSRVGPAGAGR